MMLFSIASRSAFRPTPSLLTIRAFSAAIPAPAAKPAAAAGGKADAKKAAPAKGAKGKKGKEGKLGNTLTNGPTGFASGEKVPIALTKDGADPVVKGDVDYPEWLWKVHDLPSLELLMKTKKQRTLDPVEEKRRKQLTTCRNIKENNIKESG